MATLRSDNGLKVKDQPLSSPKPVTIAPSTSTAYFSTRRRSHALPSPRIPLPGTSSASPSSELPPATEDPFTVLKSKIMTGKREARRLSRLGNYSVPNYRYKNRRPQARKQRRQAEKQPPQAQNQPPQAQNQPPQAQKPTNEQPPTLSRPHRSIASPSPKSLPPPPQPPLGFPVGHTNFTGPQLSTLKLLIGPWEGNEELWRPFMIEAQYKAIYGDVARKDL